jgi:hypothetical protein
MVRRCFPVHSLAKIVVSLPHIVFSDQTLISPRVRVPLVSHILYIFAFSFVLFTTHLGSLANLGEHLVLKASDPCNSLWQQQLLFISQLLKNYGSLITSSELWTIYRGTGATEVC